MRLALLSDIHANPIALDAVLRDIEDWGGVDMYLALGDLVAQGHDPVGVLERLTALPSVQFCRGNTDRYVVTGDVHVTLEEAQHDERKMRGLIVNKQSCAWTHGYLAATGWVDWLAELPLDQRVILADGTRLLGVHASPGKDDGPGLGLTMNDGELGSLLEGCEADVVCTGHTHIPMDRQVGSVRAVGLGCVSNPITEDLRASYAVIEAGPDGYRLELRRVPYDYARVVRAVERSHYFPGKDWLVRHWVH